MIGFEGRKHSQESKDKMSRAKTKYPKRDGEKFCSDCKKFKSISEFHKMKSHKDGLHIICKSCASIRQKLYYENNKEILKAKVRNRNRLPDVIRNKRNRNLEINYGITTEEYQELLMAQDNKCAICKVDQKELSYKLYVDHNHETGIVRGLLCKHCNSGIGLFKDNESLLSKAIAYLKK